MQPVARALSSEETVNALTDLTQRAHALIAPAQTINIVNTVEYSVGYGPFVTIIRGQKDITAAGSRFISELDGTQPFEDCTTITSTFKQFVRVNQDYLNVLIAKAGLLDIAPPTVGKPMSTSLREVKGVYEPISTSLISLCTSTAPELTLQAKNLKETLDLTIQKYETLGQRFQNN
ncbi:hypothetical protein B0H65DRAFT_446651 [Neurospora tetraspora]|uniref:Uncharacterized protein n=1 Tax=Neurospora tetraspora TaxID=94610 RepID=A0AAE0MJL1_9PEZI|nr:hypothetical protein B0H65DRAFT_446651 [Neurospora tetraspora]